MVILSLFILTTFVKYQKNWEHVNFETKLFLIYVPSALWFVSLPLFLLWLIFVVVLKLMDNATDVVANFFKSKLR